MIVYKVTDPDLRTYGGCQWELEQWKATDGTGWLCGPGWLHAYLDALLAALMYRVDVTWMDPRLFQAEGEGQILRSGQLKIGVTRLRLVREIPLPVVTPEQSARWSVRCALVVTRDAEFRAWATRWLAEGPAARLPTRKVWGSGGEAVDAVAAHGRREAELASCIARGIQTHDVTPAAIVFERAARSVRFAVRQAVDLGVPLDVIDLARQAMIDPTPAPAGD